MAAVMVALLLGEGAVRIFRPQFVIGPDPIRNPFWRHDPEIGWAHPPGMTGSFAREEFTHSVVINQAGWRDLERVEAKPDGVFRIAVLGDSFTWGHGVEERSRSRGIPVGAVAQWTAPRVGPPEPG